MLYQIVETQTFEESVIFMSHDRREARTVYNMLKQYHKYNNCGVRMIEIDDLATDLSDLFKIYEYASSLRDVVEKGNLIDTDCYYPIYSEFTNNVFFCSFKRTNHEKYIIDTINTFDYKGENAFKPFRYEQLDDLVDSQFGKLVRYASYSNHELKDLILYGFDQLVKLNRDND